MIEIATNGISSSAMPNTAPARENTIISTGMISPSRAGFRRRPATRRWMPMSTAPVSWKIWKVPPMISRKAISAPPSRKPRIGASRMLCRPR